MPNENTNYISAIKLNETPDIVYNIKDQEARTILENKVDKVSGKGLSSNDYTTAEKEKLASIEAQANKYQLPIASSTLGGIKTTSTVSNYSDYIPIVLLIIRIQLIIWHHKIVMG